MADAWLTPIITEFKTILTANLPGEIDDIDTSLEDVPTQFMHKAMMQFNLQFPSIEIYPSGQSELDPNYTQCDIDFDWRIATVINLNANNEEEGEANMQTYFTAVVKSICKSVTANTEFRLNGVARQVGPIAVDFVFGGVSGNILFSVVIMWSVIKSENPLA